MAIKVLISDDNSKNQLPSNIAVELKNESNSTEECIVTGNGYTIYMISGNKEKKSKESLLHKWFNLLLTNSENISKLLKFIFFMLLILFPNL
jgi:hypothetical protein